MFYAALNVLTHFKDTAAVLKGNKLGLVLKFFAECFKLRLGQLSFPCNASFMCVIHTVLSDMSVYYTAAVAHVL